MAGLRWTKFQDFYLRLGFLKVLIAILDPGRRSVGSEVLFRRLERTLFTPATEASELWSSIEAESPWYPRWFEEMRKRQKTFRRRTSPYVLEALLVAGSCPSQLYAITKGTTYKIVDWAADVGLVAAGNQISEKGLVLRALFPPERVGAFLQGDLLAWNPFVISQKERLFFLLHLCEIDELTIALLDEIGHRNPEEPIESRKAAEMTCRAFYRVLEGTAKGVQTHQLPDLRKARELAATMAEELQLSELVSRFQPTRPRVPRPKTIPARGALSQSRSSSGTRRTTKNADHQTVPRFEQLVDLGFLTKPTRTSGREAEMEARRKWRYLPTSNAAIWSQLRDTDSDADSWAWEHLATTVVKARMAPSTCSEPQPDLATVAHHLWDAYRAIRRPVGHTPLHSVATLAMIDAATQGRPLEMRQFHSLMLAIKRAGLLKDHAFFASGNEIDKMFILLREGFVGEVEREASELASAVRVAS